MDYALQMLLPILLGIYVGHLLDEKTGYSPWFTLGGLILGVVIGIGSLYKRALINQKQLEASRREAQRAKPSSSEPPRGIPMIFSALLLHSPGSIRAFKQRFLKRMTLAGILLGSAVCMYNLAWGILFFMGLSIGFGYILSLFLTVESGQRKFTQVLSILRMLIVSFLIVWVGQFKLLETSIVICGFLSYKVVLSLEFIDSLIGSKEHRGKRTRSTLDSDA